MQGYGGGTVPHDIERPRDRHHVTDEEGQAWGTVGRVGLAVLDGGVTVVSGVKGLCGEVAQVDPGDFVPLLSEPVQIMGLAAEGHEHPLGAALEEGPAVVD